MANPAEICGWFSTPHQCCHNGGGVCEWGRPSVITDTRGGNAEYFGEPHSKLFCGVKGRMDGQCASHPHGQRPVEVTMESAETSLGAIAGLMVAVLAVAYFAYWLSVSRKGRRLYALNRSWHKSRAGHSRVSLLRLCCLFGLGCYTLSALFAEVYHSSQSKFSQLPPQDACIPLFDSFMSLTANATDYVLFAGPLYQLSELTVARVGFAARRPCDTLPVYETLHDGAERLQSAMTPVCQFFKEEMNSGDRNITKDDICCGVFEVPMSFGWIIGVALFLEMSKAVAEVLAFAIARLSRRHKLFGRSVTVATRRQLYAFAGDGFGGAFVIFHCVVSRPVLPKPSDMGVPLAGISLMVDITTCLGVPLVLMVHCGGGAILLHWRVVAIGVLKLLKITWALYSHQKHIFSSGHASNEREAPDDNEDPFVWPEWIPDEPNTSAPPQTIDQSRAVNASSPSRRIDMGDDAPVDEMSRSQLSDAPASAESRSQLIHVVKDVPAALDTCVRHLPCYSYRSLPLQLSMVLMFLLLPVTFTVVSLELLRPMYAAALIGGAFILCCCFFRTRDIYFDLEEQQVVVAASVAVLPFIRFEAIYDAEQVSLPVLAEGWRADGQEAFYLRFDERDRGGCWSWLRWMGPPRMLFGPPRPNDCVCQWLQAADRAIHYMQTKEALTHDDWSRKRADPNDGATNAGDVGSARPADPTPSSDAAPDTDNNPVRLTEETAQRIAKLAEDEPKSHRGDSG
jgi:hypothetical protein